MGGSSVEDDWPFPPSNAPQTLVLVGKTGNGKSATGNSILGKKEFLSKTSSGGVTTSSELKTTKLKNGQILNVIDTPGLFDSSLDTDYISKEIVKCIDLARDGLHAILVVLTVRNRFSIEEAAVVSTLRILFGSKINDYMIVVFTGGDELEENEQTLEEFLDDCPDSLKETLSLCGDRHVLFDNRTKDYHKKTKQIEELLSLVKMVLTNNNGKPYTDEYFSTLKREAMRLHEKTEEVQSSQNQQFEFEMLEKINKSHEEQTKRMNEVFKLRMEEAISKIQQDLAEEKRARSETEERAHADRMAFIEANRKMEEMAHADRMAFNDEIRKLEEKAHADKMKFSDELFKVEERAQADKMKSDDDIRKVEERANATQMKYDDEISRIKQTAHETEMKYKEKLAKLNGRLKMSRKEADELHKRDRCVVL